VYLDKRNNGATSKNRRIISLKNFFSYLKSIGLIKQNVTEEMKIAKVRHREMKHLTLQQMKMVLDAISSQEGYRFKIRDYTVMMILMNTGLRNAELRNIKISHIDFENKALYVLGKGEKPRVIPLNDDVINAINNWLEVRATITGIHEGCEDYLFINQKKTYMHKDNLRNITKRYYEMTGIDVEQYHVHTIRHGALTIMMKNSGNAKAVQKISGHSSVRTLLDIYVHTDDDELKGIVNSMGIV
jgi:site-specific recombinase XerD